MEFQTPIFKYNVILVLVIIFASITSYAQNDTTNELDLSQWFLRSQGVRIHTDTGLTLGLYEYRFHGMRILEAPLLLRGGITENLSIMGGVTLDFYEAREGFTSDIDAAATFGIHYEVNDNTYIQGLFNYQLKSSGNPFNYKTSAPASFSIRSGFKF